MKHNQAGSAGWRAWAILAGVMLTTLVVVLWRNITLPGRPSDARLPGTVRPAPTRHPAVAAPSIAAPGPSPSPAASLRGITDPELDRIIAAMPMFEVEGALEPMRVEASHDQFRMVAQVDSKIVGRRLGGDLREQVLRQGRSLLEIQGAIRIGGDGGPRFSIQSVLLGGLSLPPSAMRQLATGHLSSAFEIATAPTETPKNGE